jgi:hypothetical protein
MKRRPFAIVALLLVSLVGCVESAAQQGELTSRASLSDQDGERRIVDAGEGDLSCAQECGSEARSGSYADCIDAGGDRQDCGHSARGWYRECLESRCTEDDLIRDDCTMTCRIDAAADREACIEQGGDTAPCQVSSQALAQECIDDCG